MFWDFGSPLKDSRVLNPLQFGLGHLVIAKGHSTFIFLTLMQVFLGEQALLNAYSIP